jgi:hypothetical protein
MNTSMQDTFNLGFKRASWSFSPSTSSFTFSSFLFSSAQTNPSLHSRQSAPSLPVSPSLNSLRPTLLSVKLSQRLSSTSTRMSCTFLSFTATASPLPLPPFFDINFAHTLTSSPQFHSKFSKLFSGKPAAENDVDDGVDLKEFKDVFAQGNVFAAGMSIDYADSIVSAKVASKQELATKLPVGERFFGAQVVNQASATADMLTTRIPFTGAFHLLVFAGDVAEEKAKARLQRLADYLDGPDSVVTKYTPSNLSRSAVIDVVTIRSSPSPHSFLSLFSRLTLSNATRLGRPYQARALRLPSTFNLPAAQLQADLR